MILGFLFGIRLAEYDLLMLIVAKIVSYSVV